MKASSDAGEGARALTVGAVLGAIAAGVAVGMLMAPESGAHTRRRLRRGLARVVTRGSPWDDIGDLGRRAGRGIRDRWEDLSEGIEEHRRRRAESDLVERLESRLAALEEQVEEGLEEAGRDEEPEERGGFGRGLGVAAGALLTWFLTSEQAAPARERARDVAERARHRASDEWERFRTKRNGARQSTQAGAATE